MFSRTKVAALTAEFLGTGILTYAVLSALTRNSVPAALAVGITLAGLVFFFAKTSGAHFNPAITVGFWTAGKIKTLHAITFVALQIAGAFAAFKLFEYITGQPLNVPDGNFSGRGLTAEILGTFVLAFAVAAATYRKYTNGQAAGIVGVGITIGIVLATTSSLGLLNPAVALSILGTGSYVWGIYVVGSVVGAIVAINMYSLLFDDERKALKSAIVEVTATQIVEETPAKKVTATKVTKKTTTTKAKSTAKKVTTRKK